MDIDSERIGDAGLIGTMFWSNKLSGSVYGLSELVQLFSLLSWFLLPSARSLAVHSVKSLKDKPKRSSIFWCDVKVMDIDSERIGDAGLIGTMFWSNKLSGSVYGLSELVQYLRF
ncbi:hypothetical protein F511_41365 [Dorcoceras hygrometricum]|uniref:Uncharacterized protein n=1 Tax=Dorcoceras hygrometricum TaxID=472368 RepID=A0A2Z7CYT5_9LAMI|nr:hypothetical protein F511_41365 [Dorcoceras hygrometricum]